MSVRKRLGAALRRAGAPVTQPLEAQVAALTSDVEGIRNAVEGLRAGQPSIASGIEAAIVLSRSARVVESYVAAFAPPRVGEVVINAGEEDADMVVTALEGWSILAKHAVASSVVLRLRRP